MKEERSLKEATQKSKPKGMARRILAILLSVSMLLTMQEFTSFAETRNVDKTIADVETGNDKEVGNVEKESMDFAAASATPANPVHNCTMLDDGTDTTTWSYIYFGSYPQSEVTDVTLIAVIDNAIEAGKGTTADAGTDVWVDGFKYRRISKSDTNYNGYFNKVTNNGYRYFKWERIKWRVLQNDGNSLFVLADTALDCKDYNDEYVGTTWETSTLRSWLNDSFYNTAFSSAEQNAILTQTVINEDNPDYDTEGGNNTTDNVYLLSIGEVTDGSYGFCRDNATDSVSRRLQTSAYANARGAERSTSAGYEGNCWWWLRSPGIDNSCSYAAYVSSDGDVTMNGNYVSYDYASVAPALHINLSSDLWSMEDDGSSGEEDEKAAKPNATLASGSIVTKNTKVSLNCTTTGADIYYTTDGTVPTTDNNLYTEAITINKDMTIKAIAVCEGYDTSDVSEFTYKVEESIGNGNTAIPANPVHNCTMEDDGTDTTTWSYVYFGSYPQSEVTDAATKVAIDSAIKAGNGTTADAGTDVWVDEVKYRRISKSDTNYEGYFDNATNNGYRYFKWERIKWKVLQNDGNSLFVLADTALDCKDYNDEYVDVTWETSTLRSWLNDSFYQMAFSSAEKNAIITQTVVNEGNPYYDTEGGNNTTDNVYLLSIGEVTKEAYGFCSDYSTESVSRRLKTSAYANARGAYRSTSSAHKDNCWWWLRSPSDSYGAADVHNFGYVDWDGINVNNTDDGVAPALHINLSAELWSLADDGSSGGEGNDGKEDEKTAKPNASLASGSIVSKNTVVSLTCATLGAKIYYTTDGSVPTASSQIYTEAIVIDKDMTIKAVAVCEGYDTSNVSEFIYKVRENSNNRNTATPANPVHNCTKKNDGTDTTTWSYVYFGNYPQSEVNDAATIAAIDSAITVGNGTTADAGTDVWVGGFKYRRISKSDTNYRGYFNDVTNNGYRYFKWERIKWRVLQNDGKSLFVLADTALDCKDYNDEFVDMTWETSTLRSWLNNSFYQTAFNNAEQNAVITQTVVNEDNPYYGTEGGKNTTDNVYLLSIEEVTDEAYGFCSDDSTKSVSRRLQTSAYANARGAYRSTSSVYKDNCWWRLRSPGACSSDAAYVNDDGYVDRFGSFVHYSPAGVAPALHINLSSDLWSMEDDGSSGEEEGNHTESGEDNPTGDGNNKEEQENPADTVGKTEANNSASDSTQGTANPNTNSNETVTNIKVTNLFITAPSNKQAAGKKVKLTLDITPSNATNKAVTWKSDNTNYATVDANGKVTLKKAGIGKNVTITATANDGSGTNASIKIKIMKHAVKSIKLTAPSKTVKANKSLKLKAIIKTTGKKANKSLTWTSSNTKYATVSKSGKVKAKKAGKGKTVKITAKATDGSGKKATIKIKIK